jgi:hypothetical protein
MSDYYDRQGRPIDVTKWTRLFEDADTKIVAKTQVGDAEVSTVWMGLDHGFGDGPPLIFETLVFGGPLDDEMERYSTEEQALAGHEDMVQRVRYARSATFADDGT